DVGEGWLIFDLPEADMGCHPADPAEGAPTGTPHISFYCDDIDATVAKLKSRGVEFADPVQNHGYGLVTFFRMPGDFKVQLYQPLYTKGSARRAKPAAARPKRTAKAKSKPRTTRKAKARK